MNNKKSYAEDLAIVWRLEWKGVQGLQLGSSFYTGDSSQDVDDLKTGAQGTGAVALWVGPGTVAHFRNVTIRK